MIAQRPTQSKALRGMPLPRLLGMKTDGSRFSLRLLPQDTCSHENDLVAVERPERPSRSAVSCVVEPLWFYPSVAFQTEPAHHVKGL